MKIYIYAALLVSVMAGIWWLSGYRVRALEADIEKVTAAHKVETERLKRVHDGTKRELEAKTGRLLAELASIKSDVCYRLDDPLAPELVRLHNPNSSAYR